MSIPAMLLKLHGMKCVEGTNVLKVGVEVHLGEAISQEGFRQSVFAGEVAYDIDAYAPCSFCVVGVPMLA